MTTDWKDVESKYYMFVVRRQPVVIVKGDGTKVWDVDGKEYLDFTSGWAVNNAGHANKAIADAISEQARTLLQTSNQFYSVPQLQLAEILVENSALNKVFFCNSGAEANEGAMKLARRYGAKNKSGAFEIVTALNSFHGRTMANVSATGQPHYQELFQPIPPGYKHVEFGDLEELKGAVSDNTVAVMLEPVQAEGGVNVQPEGYLENVREFSDQEGLLLIFDEVQTGMGRLGTLFGYESFGVEPDIMSLAKGLGGGVPIGAFMAKDEACAFEPGDHGSTFGGNALTCAAAYASTKYIIDNDLSQNSAEMGDRMGEALNTIKANNSSVSEVRGMGLLWAVLFNSDIGPDVVANCNSEGLLTNPLRPNAVRLMPPLTVSANEIDQAMERLETAIKAVG
ncbi:MAG: aspartate aminotransferase family protein [Dehalococcoidia bacterium]|nr:aspartate aminotransferase family protein [Dehalococcoidia bacterium]